MTLIQLWVIYQLLIKKDYNKKGLYGISVCDVHFTNPNYIRVSGSYGVSGKYAEGFVLNLVLCLLDLNYKPTVLSKDWGYGTKEDFEWLDSIR